MAQAAARGSAAGARDGWAGLFESAFRQSRNPMVLLDERRIVADANGAFVNLLGYGRNRIVGSPISDYVAGAPLVTPAEWAARLATRRFTGEAGLLARDGTLVAVQWGASTERVPGGRLVLMVAMSTSRWGRHFRRDIHVERQSAALSPREREIVRLVSLGSTGPEIADELHISHETVRTHVRNAMDKLGARSRAHLVARALGEGHVAA